MVTIIPCRACDPVASGEPITDAAGYALIQ